MEIAGVTCVIDNGHGNNETCNKWYKFLALSGISHKPQNVESIIMLNYA